MSEDGSNKNCFCLLSARRWVDQATSGPGNFTSLASYVALIQVVLGGLLAAVHTNADTGERAAPGIPVLTDHRKIGVDFSFNKKTVLENSLVSAHLCSLHSRERKKPLYGQDRVSSYYKIPYPPLWINTFVAL